MDEEAIARERIEILFEQAEQAFVEHPDRSDRYVAIAREIAMTYTLSLPQEHRMRFCSSCGSYLMPGANCRVRVKSSKSTKVVTCEECGEHMRYPYED